MNTPTGLKQIYNLKANVGKGDYYRVYPKSPDVVTSWNTTSKDIHTRKRRVMNTAFSDKAMRNAEPYVHSNVDRWCDLIAENIDTNDGDWSESLNMADWTNYLVFDILGNLCFGRSFDLKESGGNGLRHIPHLLTEFMTITHPVSSIPDSQSPSLLTPFKIALSPFTSLWVWLKPRGLNALFAWLPPPALAQWACFVQECCD